ncbi:TonB-dependent receptor [candidate division WOR-3 bacterium]|nr:TonB-dependent receptor [candidate division WOR-3 bacterium]
MLIILILLSQPYEEMSLMELLDVEVIAPAKTALRIKEVPASITLIRGDELISNGYATVAEAIAQEAGFYLNKNMVFDDMGVRGLSGGMRGYSRGLKILINGFPISYKISSLKTLGVDFLPLESIERIEIVKGPASALYGADAFMGVINIVTKPEAFATTEFWLKDGDDIFRGYQGNFGIGSKKGESEFLFTAKYGSIDRSGLSAPSESPFVFSGKSENDMESPSFAYLNYSRGDFTFSETYQRTYTSGEFTDWGQLTHNNVISFEHLNAKIGYKKELVGFQSNVEGRFSFGAPTSDEYLSTGDVGYLYMEKDVAYIGGDALFEIRRIFEEGEVMIGADYSYDIYSLPNVYRIDTDGNKMIEDGYPPVPQGDTAFINYSGYLQGIYRILPERMLFAGGVRYDKHNMYENFLSYRGGISYTLSENLYVKVAGGNSFKVPPPELLFSRPIKRFGGVLPNPALNPEKIYTGEFIIGASFMNVSFLTNLHYQKVIDKIELVKEVPGIVYRPRNISTLSGYGLEIELRGRFPFEEYALRIEPSLSFSYEQMKNEEDDVITDVYPPIMVKGGTLISYRNLNLYLRGSYIDERLCSGINKSKNGDEEYYLSSYYTLDAGANAEFDILKGRKIVTSIGVDNIMDEEFAYAGYGGIDVPSGGRWIRMSLTLK